MNLIQAWHQWNAIRKLAAAWAPDIIHIPPAKPTERELVWHARFLDLARHISFWSKDPSTQVGAVVVDRNKRVIGIGYNGFPRGVEDTKDRLDNRELKYKMVVHAETNAILNAVKSVEGATIYVTPLPTCSECAKLIIQSGIKTVVWKEPKEISRWKDSIELSMTMYQEAGVKVIVC